MREVRFEEFILDICRLQKAIKLLETTAAGDLDVKGVHAFWIYSLLNSRDGLTAAEIAAKHNINRSLVSREIDELYEKGIVGFHTNGNSSGNYNAKIRLTEKGTTFAKELKSIALEVQNSASSEIPENELEIFYSVLGRLSDSLSKIATEQKEKRGKEL